VRLIEEERLPCALEIDVTRWRAELRGRRGEGLRAQQERFEGAPLLMELDAVAVGAQEDRVQVE